MNAEQPIIVIKKKGGHGGHHGGAWKVAYADFVTAMMSLFIVLWLMSATSKQTQEEIAGYFNDPKGTASKKGSDGKPVKSVPQSKDPKDTMAALKADLTKAIENMNLLNKVKKQIEITITDEGLRIELIESEQGTFFEVGSAQPTPALEAILKVLAGQLKSLPNSISIEGHTDAHPYADGTKYGNWELSADRANVARREMQNNGIRPNQVSQVRGFADQRLHFPDKPFDAANRRISLVVQNLPVAGKTAVVASTTPPVASGSTGSSTEPAAPASKPTAMVLPQKPAQGLLDRAKGMFSSKH